MSNPQDVPGLAEVLAEETRLTALNDMAATAAFWSEGVPEVEVADLEYTGAAGQRQAARLYRGRLAQPAPVLLYIHGGGWVGGGIALNEPACRALAAQGDCSVLSVSYRLAPAHPFPAGLQDVLAALAFLQKTGRALGLDTDRIAIGGASAGANLAVATALSRPGVLRGMLLYYGVYDRDFDRPSFAEHDASPGITAARVREIFALYAPDAGTDPLVTPFWSPDLASLPPACLIAAECDVLRSENEAMATALTAAGVATTLHIERGVHHGFINRGRLLPAARACLTRGADFLNACVRD